MSDNTHASSTTTRAEWFSRTNRNPGVLQPRSGGARRDRTDDLLLAKQALSQLSYGPAGRQRSDDGRRTDSTSVLCLSSGLVGLGRFELPTSRLSSARSNQLSYRPDKLPLMRPMKE